MYQTHGRTISSLNPKPHECALGAKPCLQVHTERRSSHRRTVSELYQRIRRDPHVPHPEPGSGEVRRTFHVPRAVKEIYATPRERLKLQNAHLYFLMTNADESGYVDSWKQCQRGRGDCCPTAPAIHALLADYTDQEPRQLTFDQILQKQPYGPAGSGAKTACEFRVLPGQTQDDDDDDDFRSTKGVELNDEQLAGGEGADPPMEDTLKPAPEHWPDDADDASSVMTERSS